MKKLLAAFAATAALAFAAPAAQAAAQSADVYVSHGQQAKLTTVAWHRHWHRRHHRHYR
jgi:hypothetical protein